MTAAAPTDRRNSHNLVSIVIATNRPSRFLREALDSVVAQSHPDWELVIVDDGGPEPAALDRLAADYPGVRVVHQANAGSSIARNVGVAATEGEYLAFLDDDDVWEPQRLELQLKAFEAEPATVAGYCAMRSIDEHGVEINPADQVRATSRHDVLRRSVGVLLPNFMIKRSCFTRIGGFHPAFRRAQDLDLILRAAAVGDFNYVDDVLVSYRAHAGNVTNNRHELVRSINHIVSLHRWAARERGDEAAARDHSVSLRANRRFAAWSAAQSCQRYARERDYNALAGEVLWGLHSAWQAPFERALHSLRRRQR